MRLVYDADHPSYLARLAHALRDAMPAVCSVHGLMGTLDCSRRQLYRTIAVLRSLGYKIRQWPQRGYQLQSVPDCVYPHEVLAPLSPTRIVGRKGYYFSDIASTNDLALAWLARRRLKNGAVVMAEAQSQGRGQYGRAWLSPRGAGLWFSICVSVPATHMRHVGFLSPLCALALVQELRGQWDVPAQVKWPNDVYVQGRKLAGVLLESQNRPDRSAWVVIGMGVNYRLVFSKLPKNLRETCIDLATLLGHDDRPSRCHLLGALLARIDCFYAQFLRKQWGDILTLWRHYDMLKGQYVRVKQPHQVICGRVQGIAEDGALLLEQGPGSLKALYSGTIV